MRDSRASVDGSASAQPPSRRRRRVLLLLVGLALLAGAVILPNLAGAQDAPGTGTEDPAGAGDGDSTGVGDVGGDLPGENGDDPSKPGGDDSTNGGEDGPKALAAGDDEPPRFLQGNGNFGPLFEEPDSFIGPGRELRDDNPNEALIKQSPSVCRVIEGKDRTRGQRQADPENDGFINCKVPSGSIAAMPFGNKFISFNAVDSTENNQGSIVFEYGVKSIADRTRSFRIPVGANKGGDFEKPKPEDGGANPNGDPDADPVIPGGQDGNDQNDGGLFCADLTFLPDGRLMAVGGTEYYNDPGAKDNPLTPIREDQFGPIELQGIKNSRIYDARTNRWTQSDRMNKGRWYPALITLGNGKLFVASGVTKLIKPVYLPPRKDGSDPDESGRNVTATETFSNGRWKENGDPDKNGAEEGDKADRSLPLFPRLHLLPNGHVFYNAGGQSFNPAGQAYDQATWSQAAAYDPKKQEWKGLGVPGLTDPDPDSPFTDTGLVDDDGRPAFGFRGSTHSAMLTLKPDEDGKYEKADFLVGGGLPATEGNESPGSYFPTRQSRLTTVKTDGDDDKMTTRATGPMKDRSPLGGDSDAAPEAPKGTGRWYASTQVLPTGQVVAFAGADRDEVAFPGVERAIKEIEIFEPRGDNPEKAGKDEDGAWRPAASSQRRRTYHNTSALLPDGRILLGGHATISTGYTRNTELADRGPNGHDPTSEIWTPPNLTKKALEDNPRPKIESAPSCTDNDETIKIGTDIAKDEVDSVVLVRNASQTHVTDADQRNVELALKETDGQKLRAEVPDGNVVPPGPYMLFVNKKGTGEKDPAVPSVAKQVFVGPDACKAAKGNGNGNDDGGGNDNGKSDDGSSGDGSDTLEVAGVSTGVSNCLPQGMKVSGRGIGLLGLGMSRARTLLSAGAPANVALRAFRYCVQGGGRSYVSFSGRGVAQMIVSVKAQTGPKGLTRGNSTAEVRRAYANAKTLGRNHKNLVAPLGSGAVVFGVEGGRVRYVAVVDRRLAGNLRLLRYYLRGVRLQ